MASIEHFNPPAGKVGVFDVDVEEKGRCIDVNVYFYDTRLEDGTIDDKKHWVPYRATQAKREVLDEDMPPDDPLTAYHRTEKNSRLWVTGVIVADTPTTRGLVRELSELDRWAKKSVTGRGCYLAKLLESLNRLWD